jgi:recombination protein RecT
MNQAVAIREKGKMTVDLIRSDEYRDKFRTMLPNDVPVEKFQAVIVRAVQEDPALLTKADRVSLLLACQRAAQDGLIPDKREGALVMYGDKVQWQPMIGGLRKLLAKHGFDLRAEVVYENDHFLYEQGDEPSLTHRPPPLGQDRGDIIGAYAIATRASDGAKWREVMSVEQIEQVRAVSRAGKTGPWAQWKTEMYRKTVGRRLLKQLPLGDLPDDRLHEALARDNDNFDLAAAPVASTAAQSVQRIARSKGRTVEAEPVAADADDATEPGDDDEPPFDLGEDPLT